MSRRSGSGNPTWSTSGKYSKSHFSLPALQLIKVWLPGAEQWGKEQWLIHDVCQLPRHREYRPNHHVYISQVWVKIWLIVWDQWSQIVAGAFILREVTLRPHYSQGFINNHLLPFQLLPPKVSEGALRPPKWHPFLFRALLGTSKIKACLATLPLTAGM